MAIKALRRVDAKIPEVQQLQDAVTATLNDLTNKQLIDGVLIESVVLVLGTPKRVAHGLERRVRWIVVQKNSGADVWDSQSTNITPTKTLVLNTSANVTVDLWVF